MTVPLLGDLRARLEALQADGLHRALHQPAGVDFTSNDYLGLSSDPELRARLLARLAVPGDPVGAPGSRLLGGHRPAHARLEERLAAFKGTEAALLFASGYAANVGLLTALVRPEDRVLSDAQNHASIIDGLRLSGCTKEIFPHLDLEALSERLATAHPAGHTFLVTESLFSMDGDIAPLDRYAELTQRHRASLIVDDAHATGIFGQQRRSGLTEHFGVAGQSLAVVSTFGKALGVCGACVAGPAVVRDLLINCARSFIFSTAPAPALLAAVEASLDLIAAQPERAERTLRLAQRLRAKLHGAGVDCLRSAGPIVPVIVGTNRGVLALAEQVRAAGFDVRAVRPPTVAPGTARLRLSVHAHHTEAEVDGVAAAIVEALARSRDHGPGAPS